MATKKFKKKQMVPNIVNSVTGPNVDNTDPENPIILSGGEDQNHIHYQNIPSDYWICPNPTGKIASVTIQDTAGTQVRGAVVRNDGDVVEIRFNAAFSGKAIFN